MRGEVFWDIVEKYWVLNAWCDILKKECSCLRRKYKYSLLMDRMEGVYGW